MTVAKLIRRLRRRCKPTLYFVFAFLIGFNAGFVLFMIKTEPPYVLRHLEDIMMHAKGLHAKSPAALLRQLINLHCVLVRKGEGEGFLEEEAEARLTWASRCNSFSVANTSNDKHLWRSAVLESFTYHGKADWFLLTEQTTYVIPENARLFLLPFAMDSEKELVFGSETEDSLWPCVLMSRGAARRIAQQLRHTRAYGNSSELHFKMRILDTRDRMGRHRIIPNPPSEFLDERTAMTSEYFHLVYPILPGQKCCSPFAFAISDLNVAYYRFFHYLIQIVHTQGAEVNYSRMSTEREVARAFNKSIMRLGIVGCLMFVVCECSLQIFVRKVGETIEFPSTGPKLAFWRRKLNNGAIETIHRECRIWDFFCSTSYFTNRWRKTKRAKIGPNGNLIIAKLSPEDTGIYTPYFPAKTKGYFSVRWIWIGSYALEVREKTAKKTRKKEYNGGVRPE